MVEVRSATAGAGSFHFHFDHMAELTGRQADQVIAARRAAEREKARQRAEREKAAESASDGEGDSGTDPAAPTDSSEGREEMDFSKEFEILSKLDEDWRNHMANAGGAQPHTSEDAEKRQHFFDSLVSETSLQEHLMQQVALDDLSPKVLEALRQLVGNLDDRALASTLGKHVDLIQQKLCRVSGWWRGCVARASTGVHGSPRSNHRSCSSTAPRMRCRSPRPRPASR